MKQCLFPCASIANSRDDLSKLRAHVMQGYQCLDAWLSLSRIVSEPRQRRDCLERAAVLAPENVEIREAWLKAVLAIDPKNVEAQANLSEIETMRLLSDVKTAHFHQEQKARLIGDILVDQHAISGDELREILRLQSNGLPITTDRRLGQLLLSKGLITPTKLAHALITQQQERSQLRVAPQVLGEYLVDMGYISPQQLELALAEQIRLDQKGQRLNLGQIMIKLKMISNSKLEQAAVEHQRAFWSKYSN